MEEGRLDTARWFRLPASRVVCFLEWRGGRGRYGTTEERSRLYVYRLVQKKVPLFEFPTLVAD